MKMKYRILPILLFTLFTLSVKSQINLEQEYTGSASFAYLEGNAYYSADYVNNQCLIYGSDHSLFKTINFTVPADMYLYDVAFVSKYVFDPDELMELLVVCYNYTRKLYIIY